MVQVLTFNYGQKAAPCEVKNAKKICSHFELPHKVIDLNWLSEITKTSLVNNAFNIPKGREIEIDNFEKSISTADHVWVPNRNGVFLSIAAAFADSLKADWVVPGFNQEEAATFPDNSSDYIKSLTESFSFSTSNQVEVQCFTDRMEKVEIYKLALELKVPLEFLWPCYESGESHCGECESCQRFLRAKLNVEKNL